MATRFYLPSTGAAAVSPNFDAAWDNIGSADRLKCVTTRISSAMTNKVAANDGGIHNTLWRQYVSDPIGAQTITGTVKGQIRVFETSSTDDYYAQIVVRVVSNDGTTVTGTLIPAQADALSSEFVVTTATNRKFPLAALSPVTVTSVAANNNDRIVIEVGFLTDTIASNNGTGVFGDNSGTDLAEDETTTTANNPWIELSFTLAGPSTGSPSSLMLVGVGS